MSGPGGCDWCSRPGTHTLLGAERVCTGCRRRAHYHPGQCPGCGHRRPLAFQVAARLVCAGCAGVDSPFACTQCGREDHPYGAVRCARCFLRERLTELLNDPTTGQVHVRLRPVFDELVGSQRPQTALWWLTKKPGVGPALLARMASGELAIAHQTFAALPQDRAHDWLRDLLSATGVLEAWEPRIERMTPWLTTVLAPLPEDHAEVVRRFAHWHVIRKMRQAAAHGHLSQARANNARRRIRDAIEFLELLDQHGVTVADATQDHLDRHLATHPGRGRGIASFIAWLRSSRTNTRLTVPWVDPGPPQVTVTDADRWAGVEHLLHDDTLRSYTRLGGLFTLLFAQPLSRIVAMRSDQVTTTGAAVHVRFGAVPIQMPPILDDLVRDHLQLRGQSPYGRDAGWLFPGGVPGRPLTTENIRSQLVDVGIKPYQTRKATLFQLAAQIPAPVLAELLGMTDRNASQWAHLAARDWQNYISLR